MGTSTNCCKLRTLQRHRPPPTESRFSCLGGGGGTRGVEVGHGQCLQIREQHGGQQQMDLSPKHPHKSAVESQSAHAGEPRDAISTVRLHGLLNERERPTRRKRTSIRSEMEGLGGVMRSGEAG
ncbi:hypothetical protein PAMP_005256 [Pampus punctatissimus]